MNNQIDPITIILFFSVVIGLLCIMAGYNFGKVDGSKKAANDWNKLLEEVQKNNTGIIGEYKELIDELMLTVENKTKIIEELKKLHIEKKEPVQRLWKVGDKFTIGKRPDIYKISAIKDDKIILNELDLDIIKWPTIKDADENFNEGRWILLKDTDPVEGC